MEISGVIDRMVYEYKVMGGYFFKAEKIESFLLQDI